MGCPIRVRVLHPQANTINTPKALLRAKIEKMLLTLSFVSHLRPYARWGWEQRDQTWTNKRQMEHWSVPSNSNGHRLTMNCCNCTKPGTFTWVQKKTLVFVQTWLSVMGIYPNPITSRSDLPSTFWLRNSHKVSHLKILFAVNLTVHDQRSRLLL